jgi:hypothetical protein
MRKLLLPVLLVIVLFSCDKKGTDEKLMCCGLNYVKAVVIETSNIDCGKPVVDFSDDSVKIRSITGLPDLKYTLDQLPAELNIADKKLLIAIRPLASQEEFACLAIGINYRHLKFIGGAPGN